ncbi:hypothetical protein ACNR9Q_00690 [Maribacter sp. X9]|uniref:hypothetical protein n=1 Tax=Maribacter sp. X9 TaxID=3402159 RepID=UPI003AF34BDB
MYSNRTNSELIEILDQHSMLTFESQINLKNELKKRAIVVDTTDLETSIANKLAEIKNLDYLKDFGFEANRSEEGILVTRTKKAIFTDAFAIFMGVLVFLTGIYGCINLVITFMNGDELDVFTLGFKFAIAGLVFVGIAFFSGLKRLFDYAGFQLSNRQGMITLKKRFDVKLEELTSSATDLFLESDEDTLYLKLGKHIIFTSNADNLVQTLTLQELTKAMKSV